MSNLFKILDAVADPKPTQNIGSLLLVLLFLIIIIIGLLIGVILMVKSKKEKTETIVNDSKEAKQNSYKPKKIPLKNTSIIEDPATIRMAIEESKANINNNEDNDKIPDEESEKNTETPKVTAIHIDDNKIDDDII